MGSQVKLSILLATDFLSASLGIVEQKPFVSTTRRSCAIPWLVDLGAKKTYLLPIERCATLYEPIISDVACVSVRTELHHHYLPTLTGPNFNL